MDPSRQTRIMSILNVTPDSFSDGGVHVPTDLEALKATVASHIAAGATIIDIGGQSSRPNAPDITAEEEIARILPAIEAIKSLPEATNISISIDTYRAAVAEAAIKAGAHIINDVSAGLLDPDMLSTIARLKCTYIMMHMRGTPATMQSSENTSYPLGVLQTVRNELIERVDAAQRAGVRLWRIILDPGFGFAKTLEQNLDLLRTFSKLRRLRLRNLPWLVGISRKGFIGKITGTEVAAERVGGTAVTVSRAVMVGADIVRVHDVEIMRQAVRMTEAIYRTCRSEEEQ
jgi:2-amino-4-hydroxy-6-hydroxymethyldihydropteridine diphosphokinase/dihydropteroate synthase